MDEKKIINNIFYDIWNLVKKYFFAPMGDAEWEAMIDEAGKISNSYRECDKDIWHLYRDMFGAVVKYKETKEKERKNGA